MPAVATGAAAAVGTATGTAAIITAIGTALAGIGAVVVPAGVGFASGVIDKRKEERQQKMDEANATAKKFQPLIILGVAGLAVIIVLISIFKK